MISPHFFQEESVMAIQILQTTLQDVSCLDGEILVNGHILSAKEPISSEAWKRCDRISISPTQSQGIYRIDNLTREGYYFFQLCDRSRDLSLPGCVTHLLPTEWKDHIVAVDCALCLPSDQRMTRSRTSSLSHTAHEVVTLYHGVYVAPSGWKLDHELGLKNNPTTKSRYLFNASITDAIVLP